VAGGHRRRARARARSLAGGRGRRGTMLQRWWETTTNRQTTNDSMESGDVIVRRLIKFVPSSDCSRTGYRLRLCLTARDRAGDRSSRTAPRCSSDNRTQLPSADAAHHLPRDHSAGGASAASSRPRSSRTQSIPAAAIYDPACRTAAVSALTRQPARLVEVRCGLTAALLLPC
jgi:hypothetical protein